MSSFTGAFNTAAAAGTAGYGLYGQLARSLDGDASRVTFIRGTVAEAQFDCCLNETHSYQAQPSAFPLEYGAVVSDHITTAPIELQLTGVIADHPPESLQSLFATGVGAVGSGALSALGGAGTLAATVGYTSLASAISDDTSGKAQSRSSAMYNTLRRLAGYIQVDDGQPTAKADSVLFDVVTAKLGKKFCRFPNMCITSLQMQRDNSTGVRCLVFTLNLSEIRIAYADSAVISLAVPAKAAAKKHVAGKEKDEESESYAERLAHPKTLLEKIAAVPVNASKALIP